MPFTMESAFVRMLFDMVLSRGGMDRLERELGKFNFDIVDWREPQAQNDPARHGEFTLIIGLRIRRHVP